MGEGMTDPEENFKKVKVETKVSILFRVRCFLLKQSFSFGQKHYHCCLDLSCARTLVAVPLHQSKEEKCKL